MSEHRRIRSKVSPGFRVVVPAELRKRHGVRVGDEVVWTVKGDMVKADLRRRRGLEDIVSLGASDRKRANAVESKKRAQQGVRDEEIASFDADLDRVDGLRRVP